jgi:hypothetical protein
MSQEEKFFQRKTGDLQANDNEPTEAGEPEWFGQQSNHDPEDRGPVDNNGKNEDQIFEEFKKKYGLLEPNFITFNIDKREWQIKGMEPDEWKRQEDDLDEKWKHGRNR